MKKYQQKSLFAVFAGIIIFCLGIVILAIVTSSKIVNDIRVDSLHLIKHIDAASAERDKLLTPLNLLGYTQCDDRTLLAMRRALFDANYTIDIGFLERDKLTCTTGTGVLDSPVSEIQPDYVQPEGISVKFAPSLNLLLFPNRPMQGILVRQGNYNMVIQPSAIQPESIKSSFWQVFYKNTNSTTNHLAGHQGTYQRALGTRLPYESLVTCSLINRRYCVAINYPWGDFIFNNKTLFIIALTLCVSLALSTGLVVNYYMAAKRSIGRRVRKGLSKGSFYWEYQPIIELHSQQVIGCEVLARFKDKQGAIPPDVFIPLLRQYQQTWDFTSTMIKTAIEELDAEQELADGFKVSFNIFPHDVKCANVSKLLDITGLLTSRFTICLEITEDEYLDSKTAQSELKSLVDAGFVLSIDDFGTGYSNLANLNHLNFSQLKIDRTFVQDITTEGLKASLIPNIMALVKKFNYICIAEGIETAEQESILKDAGVNYGQGWMYARSMSIDELKRFIKQ
ncbi:EAL domain-containing protein [Pseudoalteromonas shioyasakiensis]|uniref:EAL domain-containing protein n=1 Tax=Pseudoalteromonas shioyasakiensis TaxID=1190813 RepID=UPI002117FEA0|nr:EAL domain-containing protein [Pseudoalteromonas shioyasakiensis]MCQ8878698.1 EAL domain-containing protein [Pseudoalteromonas shioyasakiensis]